MGDRENLVERFADAHILLMLEKASLGPMLGYPLPNDFRRTVGRTIVADNQLKIRIGLRPNAVQRFCDIVLLIVAGYPSRNQGMAALFPGQTHLQVPQIAQRQQPCNAKVASGANVRKLQRTLSLHDACLGSPKLMFRAFRENPSPWRPHSGSRAVVCAPFASFATLALNGSENFDAFALTLFHRDHPRMAWMTRSTSSRFICGPSGRLSSVAAMDSATGNAPAANPEER